MQPTLFPVLGSASTLPPSGKLRHSAIAAYLDCPQQYAYAYLEELEPAERNFQLLLGSFVHEVLAVWLATPPAERSAALLAEQAKAAYREHYALEDAGDEQRLWNTAVPMLQAYHGRFGNDLELYAETELILETEHFRTTTDGVMFARRDGRVWVIEHKTGSPDLEFLALWSDQHDFYAGLLRELGWDDVATPCGVIYTVIARPNARGNVVVQRFEMEFTPQQVQDAMRTAEAVYQAITTLPVPIYRSRGWHCKLCDYNKLCLVALAGGDEESAKRTLYLKRSQLVAVDAPGEEVQDATT